MAVALTLGMTSTVWAAAALPGSDPQVRALEQNRSQAEQQAEVYSTAADSKVQGEQTRRFLQNLLKTIWAEI